MKDLIFCPTTFKYLVNVWEEYNGHVHVGPNLLTVEHVADVTQVDGSQSVARRQLDNKALPVRTPAHHNAFVLDNPQNLKCRGVVKTTYTFSAFWMPFPSNFRFACYQQAGNGWLLWYVSRVLQRTYMLFYPHPKCSDLIVRRVQNDGFSKNLTTK